MADVQVITSLVFLMCIDVDTAWEGLPDTEPNNGAPNEYLICSNRPIFHLLKLTCLLLSEDSAPATATVSV